MAKIEPQTKSIPLYNRVVNNSDKTFYIREVNEIKNLINANTKDKSICITSNNDLGENQSAYLYIFDTPPVAVFRVSNHEAKEFRIITRTKKRLKEVVEIIREDRRWNMFQTAYEIARKIK